MAWPVPSTVVAVSPVAGSGLRQANLELRLRTLRQTRAWDGERQRGDDGSGGAGQKGQHGGGGDDKAHEGHMRLLCEMLHATPKVTTVQEGGGREGRCGRLGEPEQGLHVRLACAGAPHGQPVHHLLAADVHLVQEPPYGRMEPHDRAHDVLDDYPWPVVPRDVHELMAQHAQPRFGGQGGDAPWQKHERAAQAEGDRLREVLSPVQLGARSQRGAQRFGRIVQSRRRAVAAQASQPKEAEAEAKRPPRHARENDSQDQGTHVMGRCQRLRKAHHRLHLPERHVDRRWQGSHRRERQCEAQRDR